MSQASYLQQLLSIGLLLMQDLLLNLAVKMDKIASKLDKALGLLKSMSSNGQVLQFLCNLFVNFLNEACISEMPYSKKFCTNLLYIIFLCEKCDIAIIMMILCDIVNQILFLYFNS